MSSQLWWYAARAAGVVAWGLLAAGVIWGLALSTRALGRKPRPAWLLDLHRALGALAVIFTGVHVVTIMLDSYVHFGLAEVLVPLASSWQPFAVAWGIVGFYLLLAVELTSLAKKRLPQRVWRRVHYASFPLLLVATVHGLSAGTDARNGIAAIVVAVVLAPVVALTAMRVRGRGHGRAPTPRRPALRPQPRTSRRDPVVATVPEDRYERVP